MRVTSNSPSPTSSRFDVPDAFELMLPCRRWLDLTELFSSSSAHGTGWRYAWAAGGSHGMGACVTACFSCARARAVSTLRSTALVWMVCFRYCVCSIAIWRRRWRSFRTRAAARAPI